MQIASVLSFFLVALSAVSATPALEPRTSDAEFETKLDSASIAVLRKLNASCYKKCVAQCISFYTPGGDDTLLQNCFNKNCVPMKNEGKCLREQAKKAKGGK